MTLNEAINVLTIENRHPWNHANSELRMAVNLGVEALKLVKEGRCKPGGQFFHDLPGETLAPKEEAK